MVGLLGLLLAVFLAEALAVPPPAAFLNRRNESWVFLGSESSSPCFCLGRWLNCLCAVLNPGINVAITTNQSIDITSSFDTRVWIQPDVVAVPNLTDRDVGGARVINRCSSSTAKFHFSHCKHTEGIEGSMQRYEVFCTPVSKLDDLPPAAGDGRARILRVGRNLLE